MYTAYAITGSLSRMKKLTVSNLVNIELMESAAELIDYFEGKLPAELLERDIQNNDLETLAAHVRDARIAQFELEYSPEGDI